MIEPDAGAGQTATDAADRASHPRSLAGRRVAVVVLGDLGRSPRMQYHALALAREGASVDLIGYRGHPPDRAVSDHPRIRVHLLPEPWRHRAPRRMFALAALGDLAAQAAQVTRILLAARPPFDVLLVQNPPAFPTLAVARLVARARRCGLVVDWHNFGADLLALRMGAGAPVVRLARAIERALGRGGAFHLCVSDAMAARLAESWGVAGARVLRDRPAKTVAPLPLAARQQLFDRYGLPLQAGAPDRPALIVTSSSWTADEDFGVLLEAMRALDVAPPLAGGPSPRLLFVMTGAGAERTAWERRIAALGLARVQVRTVWLDAEDYPRLLAAADLGVCLHRSASGVDLPMKIADMFGAGLPVCALDYGPVLRELVSVGANGRLFSTGTELAAQITQLLDGFPGPAPALEALRRGVARLATESWGDGWRREALPLFLACGARPAAA
ncbi:MAG TPA: glycosyltransferase [Polyangia bacterium]